MSLDGTDTARTIGIATHNEHKVGEIAATLVPLIVPGIALVPTDGRAPAEDGDSFEENALIKARAAFRHSGLPSLADDSGICVDALSGAPGILSSRYSEEGTDKANLQLLLENLKGVKNRDAQFVCAIAFVTKFGEKVVRAEWPGVVRAAARGSNGFGYDPIFSPVGVQGTAAELSPFEKSALSHRARALGLIAPAVNRYFQSL
ncbi:MAG: RdgB/HAM1 family non-canonical purine pyrophosphatase [Actinomycetota bacterium]